MQWGDITFGQPSRITASIGLGKSGVVNVEREAEMSGPIHTKGVLILSGYLTQQFAQDKPLSLNSHLVFEQNYAGVDGDSSSSAELDAILSALSDVPIKQGIAVTGSVNQMGEVQAIGGVNEKIEGFFYHLQSRKFDWRARCDDPSKQHLQLDAETRYCECSAGKPVPHLVSQQN